MSHMLGALVNAGAVFVGGLLGALLGRLLNKKIGDAVMAGLALAVIYIGYSGSLAGSHTLVAILSLVIGAVIGTLLRLEDRVRSLGARLEKLVSKGDSGDFAKGFVSASLLFCVGAMAITGPLDSGLRNNHTTQYVKALIDGIGAVIFASNLGFGVLFSAFCILIYQGGITLLAGLIAPYLSELVIGEVTCVGSLLVLALGLNMLNVTKIKVMDYVPAVFLPILLCCIPFLL